MSQQSILDEIAEERKRQDAIWGGPEHDDRHTSMDWMAYRDKYSSSAAILAGADTLMARAHLVKLAALVVAELESRDRKLLKRQAMNSGHRVVKDKTLSL